MTSQKLGECEKCERSALSVYATHMLLFESVDGDHYEYRGTHVTQHPVCMKHKGDYLRAQDEHREKELDRRYARYVKWSTSCGYSPMSKRHFIEEKRFTTW